MNTKLTVDDEIKETKDLLRIHLEDLERGEDDTMFIISRLSNRLNQLFRMKLGYPDFSGKAGGNENDRVR